MHRSRIDKILDNAITLSLWSVIASAVSFSVYFYILAEIGIIENRKAKAAALAKEIKTEIKCEKTNKI